MKKILYSLFFVTAILSACQEDADLPSLEFVDPYIEFSADTRNLVDEEGVIPVVETPSGGVISSLTLEVETPFSVLNDDVIVNYTFGGNAEFGVDFSVVDAKAEGGMFTLINRADTLDNNPNPASAIASFDLDIELLSDGIEDGLKTLTVTLTDAHTTSGVPLSAGRNGLETSGVLNIAISDSD